MPETHMLITIFSYAKLFSSKERIRQYYQHVPGQYDEFVVTLLVAVCKRLPLDIKEDMFDISNREGLTKMCSTFHIRYLHCM